MLKGLATIASAAVLAITAASPAMAEPLTGLDGATYSYYVTATLLDEGFTDLATVVAETGAFDENIYDLICRSLLVVGPSNYASNRRNVMIDSGVSIYEGSGRSITYNQAGAIGAAVVIAAEEMGCSHIEWSYLR